LERSRDLGTSVSAARLRRKATRLILSYLPESLRSVLVRPSSILGGAKVLELGCGPGWFALEMARCGAQVDAVDIAFPVLRIGQRYEAFCADTMGLPGRVRYICADLNRGLPLRTPGVYDAVVIRGTLHHLLDPESVLGDVHRSLKPGGMLLVDDGLETQTRTAILAALLLLLLPTQMSLRWKLRRLRHPQLMIAYMDRHGDSPFEGASGSNAIDMIQQRFEVQHFETFAAFTGILITELRLRYLERCREPILAAFNLLDRLFISLGWLRGSAYVLVARKVE